MTMECKRYGHQSKSVSVDLKKLEEEEETKREQQVRARERWMAAQRKKLEQIKAQRDFDSALHQFSDASEEIDPMRVRGSFYGMNLQARDDSSQSPKSLKRAKAK